MNCYAVANVIKLVTRAHGLILKTTKGVTTECLSPAGNRVLRNLSARVVELSGFTLFTDAEEYQPVNRGVVADSTTLTGRGTRSLLAALERTLCAEDLPEPSQLKHALIVLHSMLLVDYVSRAEANTISVEFVTTHVPVVLERLEKSWDEIFSGAAYTTTDSSFPKWHALMVHLVGSLGLYGAAPGWSFGRIEAAHKEWSKWPHLLTNGHDDAHKQHATRAQERRFATALYPLLLNETPAPYMSPPSGGARIYGPVDDLTRARVAAHFGAAALPVKIASTLARETKAQTVPTYAGEVVFFDDGKYARVVAFVEMEGGALFAVLGQLEPAGESLRAQTLRLRDAAPAQLCVICVERVGRKVRDTPFSGGGDGPASFLVSTGFLP
jgi:hypothetical protein